MLELDLIVSGLSEENKLLSESSEERFANCEIICLAVRKVTAFVAARSRGYLIFCLMSCLRTNGSLSLVVSVHSVPSQFHSVRVVRSLGKNLYYKDSLTVNLAIPTRVS